VFGIAITLLTVSSTACTPVPVFEDGREVSSVCAEQADAEGLTVLDLSDDWAPAPFEGVPYRKTIVALANERLDSERARADRYFELYGIEPSFSVMRARLLDEERHACHAMVNDAAEARTPLAIARGHLQCDGLLSRADTTLALRQWQRRHMLVGAGQLDEETLALMREDSRELDFRAGLRALRERTVDATGIIEDGSARNDWERVLGRYLDPAAFRDPDGHEPLPNGAPDLVSRTTEAAAKALGWETPDGMAEFLSEHPTEAGLRVAVRLPPPPDYHREGMPLRAEIERGQIISEKSRRNEVAKLRPALTLYSGDTALIRWPTTVGGWKREKVDGDIELKYKASPVGEFRWRDVIAAPVWFPPPSTPGDEVNESVVGPGYRSAYGLVMLPHLHPDGVEDTFVRTHGSSMVNSILTGTSHGCHRLYNHLAIRLAAFVLRERDHVWHGAQKDNFSRHGIHRDVRGWRWELKDPIPVTVRDSDSSTEADPESTSSETRDTDPR
jgi:hypothetical protein